MTLAIITPAADLQLLTAAELRTAAGLAADDDSQDDELEALGLEAAEWIATVCGVAAADVDISSPPIGDLSPTFREETLLETLIVYGSPSSLMLGRGFISGVSLTLDSVAVDASGYRVYSAAGRLEKLTGGIPAGYWSQGVVEVTYTAGLSTVPPVMKGVARDYMRRRLAQDERDPYLRSHTINDIESVTYRDAPETGGTFEQEARRRLSRFIRFAL
jgi:hypothetical protein